MFTIGYRLALCAVVVGCSAGVLPAAEPVAHLQGEMVGEVSASSAILQSRLTAPALDARGDLPGAPGVAAFEIAEQPDFSSARRTRWLRAVPERDFVVKLKIERLKPHTRYYYRLIYGADEDHLQRGPVRTFVTLPDPKEEAPVSFVVVTGMNYARFHSSRPVRVGPSEHCEVPLGYPALATIRKLKPDFFIGTGDNVYYDHPKKGRATTAAEMRRKWHEQFVQRRYVELFAEVPTYWEKDDHDFRYNDCDNTGSRPPLPELGIRIFREQVPVTDPDDPQAVTYRTYRAGKLLQIWLLEGRDYRSANHMPDGPDKTLWGPQQLAWLKRTLLQSDAPFKLVISPTPMIGPDDRSKRDNHTNIGGFRHEGEAFFRWAGRHGFLDKGLFFLCGDRHWQYHSIHPSGFEEFSCGALVDANARLGRKPGDPKSTDPDGLIRQPFTSPEPSGGFLRVVVEPSGPQRAVCRFEFYDEQGTLLHRVEREAGVH